MDAITSLVADQWPMATLVAVAFVRGWIVPGKHHTWVLARLDLYDQQLADGMVTLKALAEYVKAQERRRR